jgi:hypothetical protein
VRLPPAAQLPPLAPINGDAAETGDLQGTGRPEAPEVPPTNGDAPPPTTVPTDAGLPCGGVAIEALKPAQLAMLISKTAALAHAEGEAWMPLLGALQIERARRLERERKSPREG